MHGDARPLVLHVVYRFDTGGLENGVVNLINHMPAGAYRHAVLALTEYGLAGIGFADGAVAVDALPADATHVGLRIMAERAARIGAELAVDSWCGKGTRVRLDLPLAGAVDKTTDADSIGPPATTEAQT